MVNWNDFDQEVGRQPESTEPPSPSRRERRRAARDERRDARRRRRPGLPPASLVPVALLLGLFLAALLYSTFSDRQPQAAPPAASEPVATAPTPIQTAPSATSSPARTALDHGPDVTLPPEARQVVAGFVTAWQQTDPAARARGLDEFADPNLAGAMKATDPRAVWTSPPAGEPQVLSGDDWRGELRQEFADGTAIILVVSVRPEAPHGWWVDTLAEAI